MGERRAFIPALTSLRFFAAVCVVLVHSSGCFGIPKKYFSGFGFNGWLTYFFVLSGFILTYCYPSLSGPGAWRKFYIARVARVWPLHALTLLLSILVIPWPDLFHFNESKVSVAGAFTLNLAMLHTLVPWPEVYFSFNGPAWSIATEFVFYLFFPFLLPLVRRQPWRVIGAGAAVVLCALLAAKAIDLPAFSQKYNGVTATSFFHVNPFIRMLEFLCGMGVALFWERFHPAAQALSRPVWTALEVSAVALFVLAMASSDALRPLMKELLGHGGSVWISHSGALPGAVVLVAVFAFNRGWLSQALAWRPMVILGEASFATYLLHDQFIRRFRYTDVHPFMEWPLWLQWPAFFICVTLASVLIWRYFETPARKFLVKLPWEKWLARAPERVNEPQTRAGAPA